MQFLDEWYYTDPFDPTSRAFQTFTIVKSLHKNASKTINSKVTVYEFAKKLLKEFNPNLDGKELEKFIRSKDRVWVSQMDMALIQWAFLGCAVLEPLACGFHGLNKNDIEDLIYTWKVFSYKLGIDPKYSLIEEIDYDLVYTMCKLVLEQEYLLHMENLAAPTGIRMSECVLTVFKEILIGTNCNVYLKYWYSKLNVNSFKLNRSTYEHDKIEFFEITKKNQIADEEKAIMLKNGFNDKYIVTDYLLPFEDFKLNGFKERMLYRLYLILVNQVLKYDWGRKFTKNVIRNAMFKTRSIRKQKVAEFEKIQNKRFEFSECPFAGGIETKEYPDIYEEAKK